MNAVTTTQKPSLLAKMAGKYNVDPEKMLTTLKATAFKSEKPISNEQLMALMIVADQYSLNPWTREIFAFDDRRGGIIPVVSVDGWTRIINEHPQYDNYTTVWADDTVDHAGKKVPVWCEIAMYRKDRSRPTVHREWFDEIQRNTDPWKTHPRRMSEHKTIIQTARRAFGFAGIYDPDEADRIVRGESVIVDLPPQASRTEQAKALLAQPVTPPEPATESDTSSSEDLPGELFDRDEDPAP